jgi:hypothetical protein
MKNDVREAFRIHFKWAVLEYAGVMPQGCLDRNDVRPSLDGRVAKV